MGAGRPSALGARRAQPGAFDDAGLPEVLAVIARGAGRLAAIEMARHFGGQRVYVPRPENVTQGHGWAQVLGLEAAKAVATALEHHETVVIPHGPFKQGAMRRAEVLAMRSAGAPVNQIANVLRVDRRTVQRINAEKPGPADLQGDLFG